MYEKLKVQESALRAGEAQYNGRIGDIRLLTSFASSLLLLTLFRALLTSPSSSNTALALALAYMLG